MPTQLPVTRTIVTLDALARAVWLAWPEAEEIDVATLFGKCIAENGWPNERQAVWNWNLGNIRGVSPAGRFHVLRSAWEIVDATKVDALRAIGWTVMVAPSQATVPAGKVCMLPPPDKQGFRAYVSLDEAIADYLVTLGRSFRHAWRVLEDPGTDSAAFVVALKADHYFSGDLTDYIRNVKSGAAHALEHMPRRPDTEPAPPPDSDAPTWPGGREPIADLSETSPATPLRAPEAEHAVRTEDPEL